MKTLKEIIEELFEMVERLKLDGVLLDEEEKQFESLQIQYLTYYEKDLK